MQLAQFNAADAADAAAVVRVWADVPWWIGGLMAGRPYPDVDALAARASVLAQRWNADDLRGALARHPRIGERPVGEGAEAAASRTEQASMDAAAGDVAARIAAGNAEYEVRFGRVFLIRAAGRSPEEILSELQRRLSNDPATEQREATEQLAEIAIIRLRSSIQADPSSDVHADATAEDHADPSSDEHADPSSNVDAASADVRTDASIDVPSDASSTVRANGSRSAQAGAFSEVPAATGKAST